MTATNGTVPLVVHMMYRFECGGLQTVVAESIKRMPVQRFRHAIVCLNGHSDFANSLRRSGVEVYDLAHHPGKSLSTHARLWRLLRRLRPSVFHTYNIGTIEYATTAMLAGVPVRIHAEHGRAMVEIDGRHRKYNLLRRLLSPVVDTYVAVSADLECWLKEEIGIPARKVALIANGVDTLRHAPPRDEYGAAQRPVVWIGTVGRIDHIKNQARLLDAFGSLRERFPPSCLDLRLAIVGDGPLLRELRDRVSREHWTDIVWLPGERTDIAAILQRLAVFVLPSLSEAQPVTILEAMACALPVVASAVGGIPQLVLDRQTGLLVDNRSPVTLADAIAEYVRDPELRRRHGDAGRTHVRTNHDIDMMASRYSALYAGHLTRAGRIRRHLGPVPANAVEARDVPPRRTSDMGDP